MSRLSTPDLESDAGPSGQTYAEIKKPIGSVPNTFATIAAHGSAALKSVLAADAVLAAGTLTKRISLAFATTIFTNVFNRINDSEIDFPAVG